MSITTTIPAPTDGQTSASPGQQDKDWLDFLGGVLPSVASSAASQFGIDPRLAGQTVSSVLGAFGTGYAGLAADGFVRLVAVTGGVVGMSGLQRCDVGTGSAPYLCDSIPEFSALWHPFVVHPRLDAVQIAFAAFVAVVFCRLAGSLVVATARQTWARTDPLVPRVASGWRW